MIGKLEFDRSKRDSDSDSDGNSKRRTKDKLKTYNLKYTVSLATSLLEELGEWRSKRDALKKENEDLCSAYTRIKEQEENSEKGEKGELSATEETIDLVKKEREKNAALIKDTYHKNKATLEIIKERCNTLKCQTNNILINLAYFHNPRYNSIIYWDSDLIDPLSDEGMKSLKEWMSVNIIEESIKELNPVVDLLTKGAITEKDKKRLEMLCEYRKNLVRVCEEGAVCGTAVSEYEREHYSGISAVISKVMGQTLPASASQPHVKKMGMH